MNGSLRSIAGSLFMSVPLILPVHAQNGAGDQSAQPQILKQFKDWAIGCDNLRDCTALGLTSNDDETGAYVKLIRGGAGNAEAAVSVTVMVPDEMKVGETLIELSLVGQGASALPIQPLKGKRTDDFVTAELPGNLVPNFIAALRQANSLNVRLMSDNKEIAKESVSLAGASASLLYMDAAQKRVGTVTALADKGSNPASSVPPVPELPVIPAKAMSDISSKATRLPAGIPKPKDPSCKDYPNIVLKLSDADTAWGPCSFAAAYNFSYQFWIAGQAKPKLASFAISGQKSDDDPGTLTNPGLSDDGYTLTAFEKGRGIGDCGQITEWVWDGKAFRLFQLARMDQCGGVLPDDWPVLFRAKRG